MNTKIKKSLLLLLTIFTFVLVSINASVHFSVTEGENLTLYNDKYEVVDSLTPIDKNGYIVQTNDQEVVLASEFAEVHVSPNTIFAITDFSTNNPSCYLIDGKVNIFVLYPQEVKFNCYTPTSNFMISSVGEYILLSSETEENFYNLSEDTTDVYDSIREKTFTVPSYTYASLFTGETGLDVTKEIYKSLSIFKDDVPEDIRIPSSVSDISVRVERYKPALPSAPTSLISSTNRTTVATVEETSTLEVAPVETKAQIDTEPSTVYIKKPKTTKDKVKLPEVPVFVKTTVTPIVERVPEVPSISVKVTETVKIPSTPKFSKVIINEQPKKLNIVVKPQDVKFVQTEVATEPVITGFDGTTVVGAIKDSSVKKNPFSLYITSSLTLDNKDGIIPILALQPNIDTGTFKANFNIDVLNLLSFLNLEKNGKSYYKYATSFINLISYNTLNEKFGLSLSRLDSTLSYDPVEIFFPEDRNYELNKSKLTLTHNLKSSYFNQYFIFDDLALNSDDIKANYTATLKFSKQGNKGFKFGTNAVLTTLDFNNTLFYPFASLEANLFSTENFSLGTEIGGATKVSLKDKYEFKDSYLNIALPMDFYGANLTLGASYNFGTLSKGVYIDNDSYSNPQSLDISLKSSYKNDFASFRLNLLLPFDIDKVTFKPGKEYLDLAFGIEKNNFKVQLGFKTFAIFTEFIEAFKENADFYATLSYTNSSFETGASLIRRNNTYNLKIFNTIKNFNYVNQEIVEKIDNRIFNFGLDVAYKAQVGTFGNISLIPFFSLGGQDYNLALQFPVAVKLHDTIFSFENMDNKLYNFGYGIENEVERVFDIINDSTTFIKKLTLGNEMTPFHLYMDRDYSFTNTSNFVDFKKYSFKDQLTTILGTRFGQYGTLNLIVPNIAMPNLVASNITIFPTGNLGDYDIEANLPVEFLIQNDGRFLLSAFPYFKANVYLKNFGLHTYFTTMVNLNNTNQANYVFNQYIIGKNQRFTLGASMDLKIGASKILLDGGAYKYRNDSEYFNPIYEMLGYSLKYESLTDDFTASIGDTSFKYYAQLGYRFTNDEHKLKLSYRVDDLMNYTSSDYKADIFNFDYSYNMNDITSLSLGCYLTGVKDVFTSLDFDSYLKSNKVLTYINLNKTFNHYQVGIQLNVAPQVDKSDKAFVNSFSTLDSSVVSISTYATLRY